MNEPTLTPLDDQQTRDWKATMELSGGRVHAMGAFRGEHLNAHYLVLVSRDNIGIEQDDWRWHVSLSRIVDDESPVVEYPSYDPVPPWGALAAFCHATRPGVAFVVGIPIRSHWMNLHPGVLHAVETRDDNLQAQWAAQAMGHRPS